MPARISSVLSLNYEEITSAAASASLAPRLFIPFALDIQCRLRSRIAGWKTGGYRKVKLPWLAVLPVIRSHYGNGFIKQCVRDHVLLRTEPATKNVNDLFLEEHDGRLQRCLYRANLVLVVDEKLARTGNAEIPDASFCSVMANAVEIAVWAYCQLDESDKEFARTACGDAPLRLP